MVEWLKKLRQHLLTGVSFAIPFIACGGILIALSLAFAPMTADGPNMDGIQPAWLQSALKLTLAVGVASFTLMLPILAAYISYSIAGKPGLVAGAIGGLLAGHVTDTVKTVATKLDTNVDGIAAALKGVQEAAKHLIETIPQNDGAAKLAKNAA